MLRLSRSVAVRTGSVRLGMGQQRLYEPGNTDNLRQVIGLRRIHGPTNRHNRAVRNGCGPGRRNPRSLPQIGGPRMTKPLVRWTPCRVWATSRPADGHDRPQAARAKFLTFQPVKSQEISR